jgi:hypothetical protein
VEELLDVGRFAHGPITHYALPMEPWYSKTPI